MTKYKKINEDEYQVIETKEEVSTVSLKFIEDDIKHKDKLIDGLNNGIKKLEEEKSNLVTLKNALKKVK